MNALLHYKTPVLVAVDGRKATVRTVIYHRTDEDQASSSRITSQRFDTRGFLVEQWDPRLSALAATDASVMANQQTRFSLSGLELRSDSVDAGWRVTFNNAAAQPVYRWDGRDTCFRRDFDEQLRPVALFEMATGQTVERCVEHSVYAATGPEDARRNRCGRELRHDDPAGSLWHEAFAVSGQPLNETRRFCASLTAPDWPHALLQSEHYITCWQYDALGAVIAQTDVAGHVRTFDVDIAGRPYASQLDGMAVLKSCEYNAFDQVHLERAGNNVLTHASYSPANGLRLSLKAVTASGHILQDLHYQSDPAGNIERIEDLAQPVQWFARQRIEAINTYRYDTLYQLIEATGRENASQHVGPGLPGLELFGSSDDSRWRNYTQTYTYDNGNNLTTLKHDAGTGNTWLRLMAVAEHSNRSLLMGDGPVDFAGGFDANGNQQQLAPGQRMLWDARNQLHQVTQVVREAPDGQDDDVEIYIYDSEGRRVRKVRRAKTAGGEQVSQVLYLPGLEIRTQTTGEQLHVVTTRAGRNSVRVLHWAGIDKDQWRYNLSDHLGSSTLELDESGELISQETYYPYGGTSWWAARSAVHAQYKTLRYSGKERDATGLYYYGMRYYAPWLQRWISTDPAGDIDGLNLFRMLRNNPLRFIDPDGNAPKEVEDAYTHMITRGEAWETLRGRASNFTAISELSGENLSQLRQSIELTPREEEFVTNFRSESFNLIHFTDTDFREPDGSITLMSTKQLKRNRRNFNTGNTEKLDFTSFATEDFVFLSLESGTQSQKTTSRFGNIRLSTALSSLGTKLEHSHMEMTDLAQTDTRPGYVPSWVVREDEDLFSMITMNNTPLNSVWVGPDMIEGLALRVVGDLKLLSSDTKENAFTLQASGQLNEVMNRMFRPQIVVPHSLTIAASDMSFKGPVKKTAQPALSYNPPNFYI